ncbi:MAG: amidohydrolase family protein [Nitrospinae bacterium]|nr:amidohydrolase family protein [Nitrospinota bacterium]
MRTLFHKLSPIIKVSTGTLVPDCGETLANAVVFVHEGKVVEICPAESVTKRRADRKVDLSGCLVHPGFVNAHCHLELSYLAGKMIPGLPFTDWVRDLVKKRGKASPSRVDSAIRKAIRRLIETGTTCVGDISSTGLSTTHLREAGLRAVVFHETLGYNPSVAGVKLRELMDRVERASGSEFVTHGVSPHAVYSTSGELIKGAAEYAAMRKKPLAIHVAETMEENVFAKKGTGPFRDLLIRLGAFAPGFHPRSAPVAALQTLSALENALLIHMNFPARGDVTRIARAKAKVCLCPNSNRWFGRDMEHPLPKLLDKKVPVALGTDSLASNMDLDMTKEAAAVAEDFPEIPSRDIFRMMTEDGARALGLPEGFGALRAGAPFDAVAIYMDKPAGVAKPFEAIISPDRQLARVFIAGRELYRKRG